MSDEELGELKTQFLVHEKECAERWKTTFNRLDDIVMFDPLTAKQLVAITGIMIKDWTKRIVIKQ